MKHSPWSDADIAALRQLAPSHSAADLVLEFGRGERAIRQQAYRHKVKFRKPRSGHGRGR